MLINRAPPMSLKLPSVLSCFVPTLGLGGRVPPGNRDDGEVPRGPECPGDHPDAECDQICEAWVKRGQIKGERPQEVHGPPSGSEAEAGGGKEPRAMAQTRLPVVTAHLGRPVIPSALWESSLPGEIRILILILFSLVSYTKHEMSKLEMCYTLPVAVTPEIRGG